MTQPNWYADKLLSKKELAEFTVFWPVNMLEPLPDGDGDLGDLPIHYPKGMEKERDEWLKRKGLK